MQKNTDGVDERILLELHPYVTAKITKRGPGGCEGGAGLEYEGIEDGKGGEIREEKKA